MNAKMKMTSVALAIVTLLAFAVSASGGSVTPALDILAGELDFIKCSLVNSDITFTEEDFERALGVSKVSSITLRSLPEYGSGTLYLGTVPLKVGDSVSKRNLDKLRFTPTKNGTTEADFTFVSPSLGGGAVTCTLKVISEPNLEPAISVVGASRRSVVTYKNVAAYGTLRAVDPEADRLTFVITEQPKHGIIVLTDKNNGSYYYTPASNYTGGDSFEYAVYDTCGNFSESVTIDISIAKPSSSLVFSDLDGHWSHSAALTVAGLGIMDGISEDGKLCFRPDAPVSRVQFLVMAMNAAGFRVATPTSATSFADDASIPTQYKGYVASALELGFISGVEEEAGTCFHPNNGITRAEAAVMLNNIIGAELPAVKPVFADSTSMPAWAENALFALSDSGIINGVGGGNIAPYRPLTRGETAQMLASALAFIG